VGVRLASPIDDEGTLVEIVAPWLRPPFGDSWRAPNAGPLPQEVHAVLAQRLFVDKTGLPSSLLTQIMRLAAFQNPEFHKKQSLRLSTATTPRIIACAEELSQHVALPRSCRSGLETLLVEHGVAFVLPDQRHEGEPVHMEFQGELTAIQEQAA
jgi:hypothetical protein